MMGPNIPNKAPRVSAPDEVQLRITFSGMGAYVVISERDNKPIAALDLLMCSRALLDTAMPELAKLIEGVSALASRKGVLGGNST